ncbi:ABC transporter ATP-binding protein [Streptomyces nigrescens]
MLRMSTLEVAGLSKSYGMKRVVNELSFIVRPGTVTGFLGPNGAGKTTTLRMLLGLTRPDSGSALVAGRPYHEHPEPMKTVGSLMDARWMHPKRSARSHLAWLARASRLPRSRVEEVLAQVGLLQVADKRVGTFSLGMSQRLGFAAALLGDPAILVLDEPANGLDPEGIAWMRGLLRTMAERGHTILVSSHLLAEMAQLADELIVVGRGRLLRQCTVAELTSETSAGQVMVRTPHAERLRPLVAAAGGMFATVQ